jgi:hypothetical protein
MTHKCYPSKIRSRLLAGLAIFPRILYFCTEPMFMLPKVFCALDKYLTFVPRPDDIYIVTYPRSGTTWLRMIMYQLATDGNMNIQHIGQVIPFFEMSMLFGRDLNALPSPRIFKTHLPYRWIPKTHGKYIYVTRDGRDVAVSYYHFYHTIPAPRYTFDTFFHRFMSGKILFGSWFKHVSQWKKNAAGLDVLFLKYEDIVNDLEHNVRKIIDFCKLDIPEDRLPDILTRCGFGFMKKHEIKLDHPNEVIFELGFSVGSFIRQGKVGSWDEIFTDEQKAEFDNALRSARVREDGSAASRGCSDHVACR